MYKQLAFFGDSYCYDSKENPRSPINERNGIVTRSQKESYIDYVSERLNLPVVHYGEAGHGPFWTLWQLIEWINKNTEELPHTYFIFCWSDALRRLVADGKDRVDQHSYGDVSCLLGHPGETVLPGPENVLVVEPGTRNIDPEWANAVVKYWLHLHNENELERNIAIVMHAFNSIQNMYLSPKQYQQYHCFSHCMPMGEENCKIEYNGQTSYSLYDFARTFDDYGVEGIDDIEYCNHFSDKGHYGMADVIVAGYEKDTN
jgi:hypothetical protein